MLFWIFVILVIIGLVIIKTKCIDYLGECFAVIAGIAVVVSLIIMTLEYTTIDSYLEANREIYKTITYKVESNVCKDEFGLLSKDVMDEIQEWNKDVKFYQNIQDNFWIGIYYPNVYDEFETIDYESYSK
jgi:hypothetical protein